MDRVIVVNKEAYITCGNLKGTTGTVIAYDSMKNEVTLAVDAHYTIVTKVINIKQDYLLELKATLKEALTNLIQIDDPNPFDTYINDSIKKINNVLEALL